MAFALFVLAVIGGSALVGLAVVHASPAPIRRRVALRLMALGLGVAIPLLAVELGSFLWPPGSPMDNPWYLSVGGGQASSETLPFERPPRLHWRGLSRGDLAVLGGIPDPDAREIVFETDHQGFRNGVDLQRAEIVFLGDSFTEAGNVPEEETFVQRVGRARAASVRNLGRAGYTVPTELIVLERYGLANAPESVVWQIAESNDLVEAEIFERWVADGRPPWGWANEVLGPRVAAWRRRSPSHRLFQALRPTPQWPLEGTYLDGEGAAREVRFLVAPGPRSMPEDHAGWPVLEQALRRGAALLAERDIALVVVLVPMKLRVLGPVVELRAHSRVLLGEDWDHAPEETLAHALERLCGEVGVVFVDATAALRERARSELVYQPLDTHLSTAGHRVVAEQIVAALDRLAGASVD